MRRKEMNTRKMFAILGTLITGGLGIVTIGTQSASCLIHELISLFFFSVGPYKTSRKSHW